MDSSPPVTRTSSTSSSTDGKNGNIKVALDDDAQTEKKEISQTSVVGMENPLNPSESTTIPTQNSTMLKMLDEGFASCLREDANLKRGYDEDTRVHTDLENSPVSHPQSPNEISPAQMASDCDQCQTARPTSANDFLGTTTSSEGKMKAEKSKNENDTTGGKSPKTSSCTDIIPHHPTDAKSSTPLQSPKMSTSGLATSNPVPQKSSQMLSSFGLRRDDKTNRVHSVPSNASSLHSTGSAPSKHNIIQTRIGSPPKPCSNFDVYPLTHERKSALKTAPREEPSSHCSLQEIESFHLQFVGNLPLLSDSCGKCIEPETVAATKSSINEGETLTVGYEAPIILTESITEPEENVVEGPQQPQEEENKDDKETNVDEMPQDVTVGLDKNKPKDERVTEFVSNYVRVLEREWTKRREIWSSQNGNNPNPKSPYAFTTFAECFANRKIKLQVPFDLPDPIEHKGRNPTLKDKVAANNSTKKWRSKKDNSKKSNFRSHNAGEEENATSSIENNNNVTNPGSVNTNLLSSKGTSPLLLENVVMKSTLPMEEVAMKEELEQINVIPMDLTTFMEECRDIWAHLGKYPEQHEGSLWEALLKTNATPGEEDQQQQHPPLDPEESGRKRKVELVDHAGNKLPVDGADENYNTATEQSAHKVASSSETKKSRENLKTVSSSAGKVKSVERQTRLTTKPNAIRNKSKLPSIRGKRTFQSKMVRGPASTDKASNVFQKQERVQIANDDFSETANETVVNDLDAQEQLVEIYRGLSRENTMTSERNKEWEGDYRAYVNGRTVLCQSLEQKTRLDSCCLRLNTVERYACNLKDMNCLPGVKILAHLSLADFMNCRLVSRNWNSAVITCKKYLTSTTFVVRQKPLGALATLETSRVRWQNIRCSVMPGINFSTTTYNGRFLNSNLRVTPAITRNEPLANTLTTVVFENFDIHKQQLVQWIQNCKRLSSLEVHNCNFLKTTISVNMDKTNKVIERIKVMKFSNMDLVKLVEVLRFFLPATRNLQTLEILQAHEGKQKTGFSVRKGAEESVASALCPALKKNVKTLKNIRFELVSTKNFLLQSRIIETLASESFQLTTLAVRSTAQGSSQPCLKIDTYGSCKHMTGLLRTTLNSSNNMTLLDFPMLAIDFVRGEDGSWLLPSKLEKLAVQLDMPLHESFRTDVDFPNLRELDLYGAPLEEFQWHHVKQTMKQLTQLVVHCSPIRDTHLQSIIQNLKSLQVLRLGSVQDVTDFGITGMEKSWIDRIKMYWPEKIDTSYDQQFPKDKIRFVGKSLTSMEDLHTFAMKGSFSISNVGLLYGFNSRELTTLELNGSPVNASNSGLFILGFQCPRLRRLQMSVKHSKANLSGIRSLYESLVDRHPDLFQVELVPCKELEVEDEARVPMIASF